MSRSFSFALHMPHWPKSFGQEPPGKPSERVKAILKKLGNPEAKLPPIVHVGGTKGKGSTIAFLRTMCEAAGYKVHAYTSPHLDRFNERIVLAGHEIDDAMLYEIIEETRIACGDMPIGVFDATTAASMLAFARVPADIMFMEMGLGGAFDATNFIDNPLLTILTTLSYDHMEYMGNTLESIAAFEAGILKPEVPCVVSYQHPDVWPVLEQKANETNSPIYAYGRHWLARKTAEGMLFADNHGEVKLPLPSLLGAHQILNAGNAIAAISLMHDFEIAPEHIIRGLMQTHWKGRLERISAPSLPVECELWFDGGHNMAAAQAVSIFVREHWRDKPFYLIFGTSLDKDVVSMLAPFTDVTAGIYSVMGKSEPKNYTAEQIAELARPVVSVIPCDSIRDALREIAHHANGPFRALVFGSLYLWLEANDKYTRSE
jgi:dihydrofolate synthase/folylpolyglutamate synthase